MKVVEIESPDSSTHHNLPSCEGVVMKCALPARKLVLMYYSEICTTRNRVNSFNFSLPVATKMTGVRLSRRL